MKHNQQFEELNKVALEKLEAYMKEKGDAANIHHHAINTAKDKWQVAWNEFLETLVVLEKLEI